MHSKAMDIQDALFIGLQINFEALLQQNSFTKMQFETKPTAVITLPYIQGLSKAIHWILGEYKIEVRFKPHTTIRQI